MNITDFEAPATPDDWPTALRQIFQRQRELMDRYKHIEKLPDPPLSLHHASAQKVLKDFAWRTTEELAESWEAFEKSFKSLSTDAVHEHLEHQREEVADALHFLVELMLFAGLDSDAALGATVYPTVYLNPTIEYLRAAYWHATYELGVAMNFLRNKPWKQSQVPTDEARFRQALLTAFQEHLKLWADLGLGWPQLHAYYFRKSEVNKFRQRSNY